MNQPKVTAFSFNAANVKPAEVYGVIPTAWYNAIIEDAEVRPTTGKTPGQGVNFKFKIFGGEFDGRPMFAFINTQNSNAQCQEIGQRELSAICHATGIINITDLGVFINKPIQIKIGLETPKKKKPGPQGAPPPATPEDPRNEIKGYKPYEAAGAQPQFGMPGAGAPPAFQQAPAMLPPAASMPVPQQFAQPVPQPGMMPPGMPGAMPPGFGAPPPQQFQPPTPAPEPVFPPAGFVASPQYPGYFQNTQTGAWVPDAELRAMVAASAPPQSAAPAFTPPGMPGPGALPGGSALPPMSAPASGIPMGNPASFPSNMPPGMGAPAGMPPAMGQPGPPVIQQAPVSPIPPGWFPHTDPNFAATHVYNQATGEIKHVSEFGAGPGLPPLDGNAAPPWLGGPVPPQG